MEINFKELLPLCEDNKKAQSLCKKLIKKFSWTSMNDGYDCMHLAYWLFVLNQRDGARKIILASHDEEVLSNQKYSSAFEAVIYLWGLESWILKQENKKAQAIKLIASIDELWLMPRYLDTEKLIEEVKAKRQKRVDSLRSRLLYPDILKQDKIFPEVQEGRINHALDYYMIALCEMIGLGSTGLYPNIVPHMAELEEKIAEYVAVLRGETAPEKPETPVVAVKRIPKKFRDICDLIRDGNRDEGIEKLLAYDGLENQKKAVLAEIAYFDGDWEKGLALDKEIYDYFGEWHYINVAGEHLDAMCFAARKLGKQDELITWLLDRKNNDGIGSKRIEIALEYLRNGSKPYWNESRFTYQPPKEPMAFEQVRAQNEAIAKEKKWDEDTCSIRLFTTLVKAASAEDALAYYHSIANKNLSTSYHTDALAICNYLHDEKQGFEIVIHMAHKRLWYVASATQVRPMEFFSMPELLPYLNTKKQLTEITKAAAEKIEEI